MYTLGVNLSLHRSACLMTDYGSPIAIADERLDEQPCGDSVDAVGRRYASMPGRSIDYCLSSAGISYVDLDVIVFSNAVVSAPNATRNLTVADCVLQLPFSPQSRMLTMGHHLAHAYSAYFPSGYDEAAILVIDRGGSVASHYRGADRMRIPLLERSTIYHARDGIVSEIVKVTDRAAPLHVNSNSIDALYAMATEGIGGLPCGSEQTVGSVLRSSRDVLATMRRHVFLTTVGYQISPSLQTVGAHLYPGYLQRAFGGDHTDASNAAIARAAQQMIEEIILHLARLAVERTGCSRLCIAGDMALNWAANTRIRNELSPCEVFVQPASDDDGTALGAALYGWQQMGVPVPRWRPWPVSLGRAYRRDEVRTTLLSRAHRLRGYIVRETDETHDDLAVLAKCIVAGQLVGWFSGGSEFGALTRGHRNLLADPRAERALRLLNVTVKQCEADRRHGASVQAERAATYFDIDIEQPDMHFACPVRIEYVERLPNVTDTDGMCRVQTVRRQENARYYDLLTEVEKLTGMAVVLNTSLNERDQPVAETPDDAIDLLIRGDLAALYLDGVVLIKEPFHHVQPKGFSS